MEINILFLSANWKVSWIKAFKKAFRDLPHVQGNVVAVDKDPLSPALYFCDSFAVAPPYASSEFLDFLLSFCKEKSIQWILPSTDRDLVFLDANRALLQENGISPLISSSNAIATCHDKWRTYEFFQSRRVGTPETFLPDTLAEYPSHLKKMILKGRTGEGSNHVYAVSNSEEMHFFLKYLNIPVVLQEYIVGIEYSVDVVSDLDGKCISAVPRERIYTRGGEVLKGKTVKNYDLMEQSRFVADELQVKGPSTIQCIVSREGKIFFTDINPRFGSGFPFSVAAGCPIPELVLKILLGEEIVGMWGNFTEELVMLRYDEAMYKDASTIYPGVT